MTLSDTTETFAAHYSHNTMAPANIGTISHLEQSRFLLSPASDATSQDSLDYGSYISLTIRNPLLACSGFVYEADKPCIDPRSVFTDPFEDIQIQGEIQPKPVPWKTVINESRPKCPLRKSKPTSLRIDNHAINNLDRPIEVLDYHHNNDNPPSQMNTGISEKREPSPPLKSDVDSDYFFLSKRRKLNNQVPAQSQNSRKRKPSTAQHQAPDAVPFVREKKIACNLNGCTLVCRSFGDLLRHRESLVHKAPSYACDCGKVYTRIDALKRHTSKSHHTRGKKKSSRCSKPARIP